MSSLKDEQEALPGVKENRFALTLEERFRQVGFAVLLLILLLALGGFFSTGYFSSAEKTNNNQTLHLYYERFGRLQTEFKLRATVPPSNTGHYIFRFDGDVRDNFQPGTLSPQPDRMYSQGKALVLVYNTIKSQRDFSVTLYLTPTTPGKAVNRITVNDEPEIAFWQFIYP
ncbi:hypothetical protein [Lelliottia nimipressuralis]|uniref:hypothetical protein n=1 Tax=Lelliottia nimipressuralis TaxID=69220 RepID=UPI001E2E7FD8|nr:hypothetical protein [Lelliottia nimipressuralis]MCD4558427.1 hypothetical protein [Lelliottia nimipressuralis]